MLFYFRFFKFYFFAKFLGFQTKMISTPWGMTFDALVVSSLALDFGLNFILAHCGRLSLTLSAPVFSGLKLYRLNYDSFSKSNEKCLRCNGTERFNLIWNPILIFGTFSIFGYSHILSQFWQLGSKTKNLVCLGT